MKNDVIAVVGEFPAIKNKKYIDIFPRGEIVLREGEHKGPNKGFGLKHIMAEHESDLKKCELTCNQDGIIEYIKLILVKRAEIYYESDCFRENYRATVVKSSIGSLILEKKMDGETTIYSIVSAFGRRNGIGIKIGSFE